jgi:hypothetical protein
MTAVIRFMRSWPITTSVLVAQVMHFLLGLHRPDESWGLFALRETPCAAAAAVAYISLMRSVTTKEV